MRSIRSLAAIVVVLSAAVPWTSSRAATACAGVPLFDDRCERWAEVYTSAATGGPSLDDAYATETSPLTDMVYVTGLSRAATLDVVTLAYDRDGNQKWAARFDGPAGLDDGAFALAVSPDGARVYVAGFVDRADAATSGDLLVVSYDAVTGDRKWTSVYAGPGDGADAAYDLVVAPDGGRLYAVGLQDHQGSTGGDMVAIAVNAANGQRIGTARVAGNGTAYDVANAAALTADGKTLLVGGQIRGAATDDYGIAAYATSATSLTRRWLVVREGGASAPDTVTDVGASPDGSLLYATGYVRGPFGARDTDYMTVALSAATGAEVWSARYAGPNTADPISTQPTVDRVDEANALLVGRDGTVYVTGTSTAPGTGRDVATLAYNGETGAQKWVTRYAGYHASGDVGTDLAIGPDGAKLFVTGYTQGQRFAGGVQGAGVAGRLPTNTITIAYSAPLGTQLWTGSYNGSPAGIDESFAGSVAVSSDGKVVYVAGASVPRKPVEDGDANVITLAYIS